MSKYGNIKTRTSDGIVHDSMKEANRWCELKMLEKAGLIQDLQRQVKFELIPKQDGERAVHYVADFVYVEDGKKIVEEAAEVWMAAEYESDERTAEEISQLLYHLQVMMIARGLTLEDVYRHL